MARERGYSSTSPGFEAALEAQRKRSQDERKSRRLGVAADALDDVRDVADAARGLERRRRGVRRLRLDRDRDAGDRGQASHRRPRRDHAARVAVLRRVGRADLRSRRDRRRGLARRRRRREEDRRAPGGDWARLAGHVPLRARRWRACRATAAATRSAITPRRICCMRRCARSWARACIKRDRSSRPSGCVSTLLITVLSTRSDWPRSRRS